MRVWLKSGQINYLKPGRSDLFFNIKITETDIDEIEQQLHINGKHIKAYPIEMYNKGGELCVTFLSEVYIRNLNPAETRHTVSI